MSTFNSYDGSCCFFVKSKHIGFKFFMRADNRVIDPNNQLAPHYILGIAASANDVKALVDFVANLSIDLNCSYIIAQDSTANDRSFTAEFLSLETCLPVQNVVDKQRISINTIYIIPPGFDLNFSDGLFQLIVPTIPSANRLFQTLAKHYNEYAIGVVLSGSGMDGTTGLRAIKTAGGITYAQVPDTAIFESLPQSAIDAGLVDRVMASDQIAQDLRQLMGLSEITSKIDDFENQPQTLTKLFRKVLKQTKIDFSNYKLTTVLRRLQRRLLATESDSLETYLSYVNNNPGEVHLLAREVLVSITEFFRDQDAFYSVGLWIRELIERKKNSKELRVWVVGCATGEEAYSLAILFAECYGEQVLCKNHLQVFATDIDNNALNIARRGTFKLSALQNMPAEYLSRYFILNGEDYEPIKELRDCVIFARQDIISDPPFLKVDLIVCRNVLSSFNPHLQSKVLMTLHYALQSDGVLFLGSSDDVAQQETLFTSVDATAKLFKRRSDARQPSLEQSPRGQLLSAPQLKNTGSSHERLFLDTIGKFYAPLGLLIDSSFNVVHLYGAVEKFIGSGMGGAVLNLARHIVPEFRSEIITVFHRTQRKKMPMFSKKRRIASLSYQTWRLGVFPTSTSTKESEYYLIVFELIQKSVSSEADELPEHNDQVMDEGLENQLKMAHSDLQIKFQNIQLLNEELQSSNEDLELINLELFSTKKQLMTVNEESLTKSSSLTQINNEYESIYNTIDFPVMVFDENFCLKRVNKAAQHVYELSSSDKHQRHVSYLRLPEYLGDLEIRIQEAFSGEQKISFTTYSHNRNYKVVLLPSVGDHDGLRRVLVIVIDHGEREHAQQQIIETQQRLSLIMNHSLMIVSLKDAVGRYEFVNYRFEETFGIIQRDILGKTDRQIFEADLAKMLRKPDLEVLEKLTPYQSINTLKLGQKAQILEMINFPILDKNGIIQSICMQAHDVTHKIQAEEQLRLAAQVFERASEAIMITDAEGHILTVNAEFLRITGYSPEEVIGKTPAILKSGQHDQEFYRDMWNAIQTLGGWQGEIINRRADGANYTEWLTISVVHDAKGKILNYLANFSDISSIKAMQNRIEHLATHDELTGLANRTLMIDCLRHDLAYAKRNHENVAVLSIDLDNFSNINDTLGQNIGDLILKQVAERLQNCMRDSDTLARIGGDEFVAIMNNVEITEVNLIAARIIDFLAASFHVKDRDCFLSASIGIGIYPHDGEDSLTLLKNADIAMHRAKDHGRNQYVFFAEAMKIKVLQRMTIEIGLRIAIATRRLYMEYQPKIELATGQIVGVEALLRWNDPDLGDVAPIQFIPIAEKCGLMMTIGEQIIDMVMQQIHFWHSQGMSLPPVSINLSAHQLHNPQIVEILENALARHKISARGIILEITENMLMERIEFTATILRQLVAHGFQISIDDFGTGYSSLLHLKRLPIHELKIDRSFIKGLETEQESLSICEVIIKMGLSLNLQVVAEGVETEEQLRIIQKLGCEQAQGYLYCRPLSADQFAGLLTTANISQKSLNYADE